jgi:adenosyl cobinamide kinase/adenosyl cobinamide phosphate guanylyltransferase
LKDGESYSVKVVSGVAQVDPDVVPVTNEVGFSIVYSPSFSEVIVPSREDI